MASLAVVPSRRPLYEQIAETDEIAAIIEALDEANELTAERFDELSRELIAKIAGTRAKIDQTCAVLAQFEQAAEAAAAEAERLNERRKYFDRQRERLEAYVIATLEASKLTRLDGDTSAVSLRLNPARVVIDEGTQLGGDYLRIPAIPGPEPDRSAIKAALSAGVEVPGCRLERAKRLVRS